MPSMDESELAKISCVVHTRDSAETLEKALRSVAWADELIIVDMDSDDETVEIAARFTEIIFSVEPHPRVDAVRNRYLEKASHEWILVLDSDEYLAADGREIVQMLIAEHGDRVDAFRIPRFNSIAGQILRGSEWYPDHQTRLFRKGEVTWDDAIHETPKVRRAHRVLELEPPHCLHIHHRNYRDVRHFIERQLRYALDDHYDPDPAAFDFSEYVSRAYRELALRSDTQRDGDLSHALALAMAWDSIVRGLVHWDSLEPRPSLDYLAALPVATEKVGWTKVKMRRWLGRHYPVRYILRRLRDYANSFLGLFSRRSRGETASDT